MKNLLSSSRRLWYRIIASFICNCILNSTISTNGSAKTINKNGDDTCGWMYPEGEVIMCVGQYLEIFCTINSTIAKAANVTSSDLEFQEGGLPLNSPNVTTVNETTIRLYLLMSNQSEHVYGCYLKAKKARLSSVSLPKIHLSSRKENSLDHHRDDPKFTSSQDSTFIHGPLTTIGFLRVTVGEKPGNVMNFQCKSSLNYTQLCCSWNSSVKSVKTTYTIQRMESDFVTFEEPDNCDNGGMYEYQCCWLDFLAHSKRGYFNFKITGENMFGARQQILNFDRFKLKVKPSFHHVYDLSPLGTSISILTNWVLPSDESLNFDDQLVNMTFELCFRNYHQLVMNWSCCQYLYEINVRGEDFVGSTNFTSLLPNSMYEFLIRCKFLDAPQHKKYWSDYAIKSHKTDLLRETGIGLYYFIHKSNEGTRSIRTLWLPKTCYYDINETHIDIIEVNKTSYTKPADQKRTVDNVPGDWTIEFDIGPSASRIVYTNRYKHSKFTFNNYEYLTESTSINIPAFNHEVELCALFYVVQHANNTYEYIWQPPEKQLDIINYTLFWQTRPNSYTYNIMVSNWTYVSTNQSEIPFNFGPCMNNVSILYENDWKFYISANTEKYSSSLQQSVELVSSVTDFWKNKRFLELEQKWSEKNNSTNTKAEFYSKTRVDIGRRLSEDQFYDWMKKLHGVKEPVKLKGRKNVIRIREHYKIENYKEDFAIL